MAVSVTKEEKKLSFELLRRVLRVVRKREVCSSFYDLLFFFGVQEWENDVIFPFFVFDSS